MGERLSTNGDMELSKLIERVAKTEWRAESIDQRLSQGAEAFSDLRASIGEVRKDIRLAHEKFQEAIKPKPVPMWRILGLAFSAVCVAAGLVWMFARYPDREEFNKAQDVQREQVKALDGEIDKVKEKQTEIRTDQKLIKDSVVRQEKTQEKLETKIDRLLDMGAIPRIPPKR